jgi:signal transduction histidine kinase
MNSYLADTLFLNLIKNAIMHNIVDGEIIIKLDSSTLSIINTGPALNITDDIFKRFIRSENKDSLGIGLSIVKKICDYYLIPISYNFNKAHEFTLILQDEK